MTQSAKGAVPAPSTSLAMIATSWVAVGLPLAWGVSQTLAKAVTLFQ